MTAARIHYGVRVDAPVASSADQLPPTFLRSRGCVPAFGGLGCSSSIARKSGARRASPTCPKSGAARCSCSRPDR